MGKVKDKNQDSNEKKHRDKVNKLKKGLQTAEKGTKVSGNNEKPS